MPQIADPPPPGASFESSRAFVWLTRPPGGDRPRAIWIVVAMLGLTGLTDYASGVRVSLQLFYLAPIAVAAAQLGRSAAHATSVTSVLLRVAADYWSDATFVQTFLRPFLWNRTADLCVYVLVVEVLLALISVHRRLEERVRERTADLRKAIEDRDELQTELFAVSRRERAAIGRELHDDLGQHLTATALAADVLAGRLGALGAEAAEGARTVVKLVEEAIGKTRLIARGLLLSAIEPGELTAELESLARSLTRDFAVPCRFVCTGALRGLDDARASHLYYIAQEAARNALKHGSPSEVTIRLESAPGFLTLTVEDDGRGMPPDGGRGAGMGLRIMEHRAALVGGSVQVGSAAGAGTRVACTLPLAGEAPKP